MRMFYALKAGGHETAKKLVELIQEMDELEHTLNTLRNMQLNKQGDIW